MAGLEKGNFFEGVLPKEAYAARELMRAQECKVTCFYSSARNGVSFSS